MRKWGAAMPQSGGRVVYLNEAYHPIVGFMNGFVDWLIGGPRLPWLLWPWL